MCNDYYSRKAEIAERVTFIQEEARALIAFELHDGLVQKLTGALMLLQAFERQCDDRLDVPHREALQRVIALLDESLREARRLLRDWQPAGKDTISPLATRKPVE